MKMKYGLHKTIRNRLIITLYYVSSANVLKIDNKDIEIVLINKY